GDSVTAALLSRGHGEYLVTTGSAQTLRFSDEALRAQGRVGQGVTAMTLAPGAQVISASYLDSDLLVEGAAPLSLFVITGNGLAKKVPIDQYPQKGRATSGVITTELIGDDRVLLSLIVGEQDHLLLTWRDASGEQAKAIKVVELKALPRA